MPAARDAATVELGAVVEDLEAGARRDAGPHRPVGARRHIVEARAGGVRTLRHESLGGERPEVAVDRRETHARQPPAHAPVDERRGRMRVGRADDLEDDPALPREPEAPGAERSVGREGNAVFSNHYQQADAVYPARQELSTAGCSGASCPLPVDYPPQEDRSNGPALWAPDPRSPAEQPQERLARDPARPAHASRRSPSTRSSPKGSGATSSRCPPTRACSSIGWTVPTWTASSRSGPRWPSSRRTRCERRARRSAPPPRSTIICACSTRRSGASTAPRAAPPRPRAPPKPSSARSSASTPARAR